MQQHDPEKFLREFAKKENRECHFGGGGSNSGMLPCRKNYQVEIDGGLPIRDKAMNEYYASVRHAITGTGLDINGHDVRRDTNNGSVHSFLLDYGDRAITGFVYATAVVNDQGNAEIVAVMYEHPRN